MLKEERFISTSSFRRFRPFAMMEKQKRTLSVATPLSLNLRLYLHYCSWHNVAQLLDWFPSQSFLPENVSQALTNMFFPNVQNVSQSDLDYNQNQCHKNEGNNTIMWIHFIKINVFLDYIYGPNFTIGKCFDFIILLALSYIFKILFLTSLLGTNTQSLWALDSQQRGNCYKLEQVEDLPHGTADTWQGRIDRIWRGEE